MKDYYAILGVSRNASNREIKKAYRRLAWRYHPDLHGGSKEKEERFKEMGEAYAVLGDRERRPLYDRTGEAKAGVGSPAKRSGKGMIDTESIISNFMDLMRRWGHRPPQ